MTDRSPTDRIEKTIDLAAPLDRVWRAITDHEEFGRWFRVRIDGPFVAGETSRGHITYPGYEHLRWEALILTIEPPHTFAFAWPPYADDPAVDHSGEPWTTVTFTLEPTATGTRLRVVEDGFDRLPAHRRAEAFRMNEGGWEEQTRNIARHVAAG